MLVQISCIKFYKVHEDCYELLLNYQIIIVYNIITILFVLFSNENYIYKYHYFDINLLSLLFISFLFFLENIYNFLTAIIK